VIISKESDVVRLGPNVKGKVYVYDNATKSWTLVGPVKLPEGWYAGPGPK
jgi:hypothetical protein